MRSALVTFIFILFFCGSTVEEQIIAQHGISEVCPGNIRRCKEVEGVLTYTTEKCTLSLDTFTNVYKVIRWLPKERILHVEGETFTGFFIIKDTGAMLLVNFKDKRRHEEKVYYRFYETIRYDNQIHNRRRRNR